MLSDVLGLGLSLVNLALHLLVCGCIMRQVWGKYRFPDWTRAWVLLLVVALCILPFRVSDLLEDPDYWRKLLAFPMTLALYGALRLFQRIFADPTTPPYLGEERDDGRVS
jgi:hypothetical protein